MRFKYIVILIAFFLTANTLVSQTQAEPTKIRAMNLMVNLVPVGGLDLPD